MCGKLIPSHFVRLDFVAEKDDVIPPWQNGKHITTIWVHPERFKKSTSIVCEVDPLQVKDNPKEYISNYDNDFNVDEAIIEGYKYIDDYLG